MARARVWDAPDPVGIDGLTEQLFPAGLHAVNFQACPIFFLLFLKDFGWEMKLEVP